MKSASFKLFVLLAALVAPATFAGRAWAARPVVAKEQVELFAAMRSQQIEVKLVPKDATQATVMIRNKTDKPLTIQLPDAFVGMPVLAQDAGGGGRGNRGGGGGNNNSSSGQNQSMGGGMGGMMGGMGGGMGMGGGFFDVGPDRVGKFKVTTVCLEHGKEDPNPRVAYELRPISDFTDKAELVEVCEMLGRGELDQKSAQAAAWHLSDSLTWQELAAKVGAKHLNGSIELWFTPSQLQVAMQAVGVAHTRAAEEAKVAEAAVATSPGELAEQAQ